MNKEKYYKYIILGVGLLITVLLTIALIYLNKVVFENSIFKTYTDYKTKKVVINDLFGLSEILVVASTMILFLKENNKK